MLTRPVKLKVGSSGWLREGKAEALPAGCAPGTRIKVFRVLPSGEFYVVDQFRNGLTISQECIEPEVELSLPWPQRGWAHEADPRALAALPVAIENERRLANNRPDLYPHFLEKVLARNQNSSP